MKLRPVRGMKDLFPEDFLIHDYITSVAKKQAELYGFAPMSVPIVEYTEVFTRTLGSTSDVVSKEIYNFIDKSDDSVALRPEFTAGVMRSFISSAQFHNLPLKFFSYGPLFRYDRPQAGRQRQFNQLNYEFIGAEGAYTDAEIISLGVDIFKALEIDSDVTLELNSLGCVESRKKYQEMLQEYFSKYLDSLSEDSKRRLDKNPMRILDSKDEGDQKIASGAPKISSSYNEASQKYFDDLQNLLQIMNIKYKVNPKLVRGLDYYCHTAFEFTTDKLGAQSAVGGGGRYDGLSKLMGGPDVPAIGFALGLERIALMREFSVQKLRPFVLIPIGDENLDHTIGLAAILRSKNIPVLIEHKGKIGKRMQNADKANAKFVIFIGSDEVATGKYKCKNMDSGEEILSTIEAIWQK